MHSAVYGSSDSNGDNDHGNSSSGAYAHENGGCPGYWDSRCDFFPDFAAARPTRVQLYGKQRQDLNGRTGNALS
jgi:hypothetical protein